MMLSESAARAALAALRSDAPDEPDVDRALSQLLQTLPAAPSPRRRLLVPALGVGALGVAIVLVLGLLLGTGTQGRGTLTPGVTSTPAPVSSGLATGLATVGSLVDVGGYLWASGSHSGGTGGTGSSGNDLVHVQISTRRAGQSVLMTTNGLTVGVSHLTTFDGRVYAVGGDGGVRAYTADGTAEQSSAPRQLGTSAQSLAASPTTGLWLLSCCGAAPAAQSLVQQRDPKSLAAVGDPRDISPFNGSVLAAGPAGVWLVDGGNGNLRRIDEAAASATAPVLEPHPDQLAHDVFAVGSTGPVLATPSDLIVVDAGTLAVRKLALAQGLTPPSALTVIGTTAYLAYPDELLRYDLTTLTETGTYLLPGVTAMAGGSDGVWAAARGRLVRLDTLPALPPEPGNAGLTSIPTGLQGINALVDVDGELWVSALTDPSTGTGTLRRVDLGDRSVHSVRPDAAGILRTDGAEVFLDHGHPGVVQTFAADGRAIRSEQLQAIDIAGSPAGLSVLSCCSTATPNQNIRLFDPTSLAQIGRTVDIDAPGGQGQLIAGAAGTWFLTGDATSLYRVDTSPVQKIPLDPAGSQSAPLTAMGSLGPLLVTGNGRLSEVIGNRVTATPLPGSGHLPTAMAVSGQTVYVAFPDRVLSYDLPSLGADDVFTVPGVTALTAGSDGVWAAGSGNLIQLARG